MRQLIQQGNIIDGTGSSAFVGDILLEDDRILEVGRNLHAKDAVCISAEGQVIAPAFVDIHRHMDAKPLMHASMDAELHQGVATCVTGNCGFSLAPHGGEFLKEKRENDIPILGTYPESFRFDFSGYLDALEKCTPDINTAAMIGMGAVRIALNGFSASPLTSAQLDRGCEMIREALTAGAAGVSAGIMYLPEFYTTRDEYKVLLAPLKGGQKPLITHIRGEGDSLVSSIDEVIAIAKDAECPLEISHFKSCGMQNWNKEIYRAIEHIEKARSAGQDITVDFYPYIGGSTALTTMLPPAFVQGDLPKALAALGTPAGVEAFRKTAAIPYSDWDNYAVTLGWDRILIASAEGENQKYIGMSLPAAAEKYGFEDAVALAAHLMHSENGRTAIINLSMDQRDVDVIAQLDYASLISDSIYADTNTPHPRLYGAFPRFIEDMVFNRKILSLETAVHKMTQQPAQRMQLDRRGCLSPGNFADIIIFKPENLHSPASFEQPAQFCSGIQRLIINGVTRVENDRIISDPSGRTLRIR